MVVCVHCGAKVEYIYRDFGDGNIRLHNCPSCKKVADKYIEFDRANILIETILLREEVYRHLMFNYRSPDLCYRGGQRTNVAPSPNRYEMIRAFLVVMCCDVYTKWRLVEGSGQWTSPRASFGRPFHYLEYLFAKAAFWSLSSTTSPFVVSRTSPHLDSAVAYLVILTACLLESLLVMGVICLGAWIARRYFLKHHTGLGYWALVSAVIHVQFGKVSPLLMLIWDVTPGLHLILSAFTTSACFMVISIFLAHKPAAWIILLCALVCRFLVQYTISRSTYAPYPCSLAAVVS